MSSTRGRHTWSVVGVLGELLVTVGVVLALFVVYQVFWTDIGAASRQADADRTLSEEWENERRGGPLPDDGPVAFARLHIPAFGSDYRFAVVEGVGEAELEVGPGHYPETQRPGEPGNFAVAGHRVGRGSPFNDLDALDTCDALVYETRDEWFEYRVLPVDPADRRTALDQAGRCLPRPLAEQVTSDHYAGLSGRSVTTPQDVGVIHPVPNTSVAAEDAVLPLTTLTTCHPQFSAAERLVVHAVLVGSEPRIRGEVPDMLRS